jgi:2-deoxy-D-gluconate 3-dehydrogenase
MVDKAVAGLLDLTGKSAVVTGGGAGIGEAICLRLAQAGAGVTVMDIDSEAAGRTVEQIKSNGGEASAVVADAANVGDAAKVVGRAVEVFGGLDILVNNAGAFPHASVLEVTEEMWDLVLNVNLRSVMFYSQAAARKMIEAGRGGKIVNIASMEGLHPREDLAHYVTAKAGVAMLTKALALELAPHNILVNAVAPGGIMTAGAVAQQTAIKASGKSLREIYEKFMARLPLGRMGEPDDVARVVLFLASPATDYMTGSVIVVDGGFLLS